jgi:hypothetical protein
MRRLMVAALISLGFAAAVSAAHGRPAATPAVFNGAATWVDIFDTPVYAQPEQTAARIAARGVRTVFAETANYRAVQDVVKPAELGRFVQALQARGVAVVGWYLPGFKQPGKDLRRTRAMLNFATPAGRRFDAVALDIEALVVTNVPRRTQRMLDLARTLRAEAGEMPVAAITYPPRMLERHLSWWPGFPWAELVPLVDAFVPMAYTGGGFRGYDATYGYVARSLKLLRQAIGPGVVVHAAGGVANRMNAEELKAFVDAVRDDGTISGWSFYDYQTTTSGGWSALAAFGQ